MKLSNITTFFNTNKTNILLAGLCVLFAWLIINWFRYLVNNYFILDGTNKIEGFEANIYNSSNSDLQSSSNNLQSSYDNPNTPLTTHSVDLPINTNFTCSNVCGPTARCSKSGQQCSTDVDCYNNGCQSLLKPPTKKQVENVEDEPEADYDAGILTYNQTPQYSSLTTDIGTEATVINKNAELPRPYQGLPVWEQTYNKQAQMEDDKLAYKYSASPEQYRTAPFYPVATTITGVFYDIGPTPANASIF